MAPVESEWFKNDRDTEDEGGVIRGVGVRLTKGAVGSSHDSGVIEPLELGLVGTEGTATTCRASFLF